MLAVLTGLGLSAAAGLNAYIPFLVVALIDSVNDAIQTVVRPASAGIIVAATSAAARPVINAGTLGTGAPVVSAVEDTASISLSLLAIFVPVLALLAVIALLVAMGMLGRRALRSRKIRPERGRGQP